MATVLPVVAAPTDLPTGGAVVAGSANIITVGSTMTVATSSTRTIMNWNSFSIGNAAQVNFFQPNANSAALNRVTGADISQIMGTLNSNGSVFLINPNGVVVGMGAQFSLPSITINTSSVTPSNTDFMNGLDSGFLNVSNAPGGDFVLAGGALTASNSINLAIAGSVTMNGIVSANNVTINCGTCIPSGPINPTGLISFGSGLFVNGGGSAGLAGGDIVILNSPSAIVNWSGFNIGQTGTVSFAQPGSSSAVANRIDASGNINVSSQLQVGGLLTNGTPSTNTMIGNANLLGNGQLSLIAPNGTSIPTSTPTQNVMTLTGQSLQSGSGTPIITLSPSSAQKLADRGQVNVVSGQVQITPQGAADVMNSLVNTGGLSNGSSMTANGNVVSIGL